MTYLVFDAVILAVLALAAFLGYRRGLILTLCGFLAVFVAFFGATKVSDFMSGPLSRTLQPALESRIQDFLDERMNIEEDNAPIIFGGGGAYEEEEEENHAELPIQQALDLLKESRLYGGFAEVFQRAENSALTAISSDAARVVSTFIASRVATTVLFYLSFVLILVLWALLSHTLDLAFRLPVLSSVNRWSGAALGLLQGVVLLLIVCWFLGNGFLPQKVIRQTVLLRLFCSFKLMPLSL